MKKVHLLQVLMKSVENLLKVLMKKNPLGSKLGVANPRLHRSFEKKKNSDDIVRYSLEIERKLLNILMHPFHMLGNIYASTSSQNFYSFFGLFWCIPENLRNNFARSFETHFYGEHSLYVLGFQPNPDPGDFFQKFFCIDSSPGSAEGIGPGSDPSDSSLGQPNQEKNPVLNHMAPRQLPGVYLICCTKNNKYYFGQSQNVSARLSQHKSRLGRKLHEIQELQNDLNLYGEKNFEFFAVSFFERGSSKEERVELENKYVNQFQECCSNKFLKTSHKKENNPFWGKKHTKETTQQISKSLRETAGERLSNGLPITLDGVSYSSLSEASRQTSHSRDTIRRWLRDEQNTRCFYTHNISKDVSEQKPKTRLNDPSLPYASQNTGLAKAVNIYGTIYPSIAEAARQRDCSRSNIQRLLRTFPEDCFFIKLPPPEK